jgi:hypothetical protein
MYLLTMLNILKGFLCKLIVYKTGKSAWSLRIKKLNFTFMYGIIFRFLDRMSSGNKLQWKAADPGGMVRMVGSCAGQSFSVK